MSVHAARTSHIDTPTGTARVYAYPAVEPLARLVLGHGAGGGVGAQDLQAIAEILPTANIEVVLVEQPWVAAGKRIAPAPSRLDIGWSAVVEQLSPDLPLVIGGRSAGARVAVRTAAALGAIGVLALAFPLHAPGRPQSTKSAELLGLERRCLVVQGTRDGFGSPQEILAVVRARGNFSVVSVEGADHSFTVLKSADRTQRATLELIAASAVDFVVDCAT